MHKRDFLRSLSGAGLGFLIGPDVWAHYAPLSPSALAATEDFWDTIRAKFLLPKDFVHLENGYYLMQSEPVLTAFLGRVREVNRENTRYMRLRREHEKVTTREELAVIGRCDVGEVIVTRNATESLDTIISGFDWRPGDEAVMADQDYGAMLEHFRLQARRYGMVNRLVSVPMHPNSDDDIVEVYAQAITPRTKLLMVCHQINITGQILPIAKIAAMAHRRGVRVMVDGAHTFGQFEFAIPELGADYYGASLHKWLATPLGAGLLWVKRDRIAELWPIFGEGGFPDDDIRKLNHTGTHPSHTDLGIRDAIAFHHMIGGARKEARFRYLQQYWTTRLRDIPGVNVNTPADAQRSCAIGNVGVDRMLPAELAQVLFDRYKVWTVAINGAGVRGVRVTPHVFTSTQDLDVLVRAVKELAG